MRIYTKNPNCNFTPVQLMTHIQSHGSVIGLCLTPEPATQYLFDVKNNELRRYPIRMITQTTLDNYAIFQNNDFENPASLMNDRAPRISGQHSLFTENEIEEIIKDEKQCPYLEGSPLSREQQDLLYSGVVVPRFGISFYYFLTEYILPLPHPEKVLQGVITHKEVPFNDDDKEGKSARDSLLYNFLAPNRIVFFEKKLYPNASHKPTVGAILDFYIHCMQMALRKLGHETVATTDLRTYSERSRAAQLGDLQYHFTEDEIYEPQGLSGTNDIIFRFVALLLIPQNQTTEAIATLIHNPGHADFLEYKIALYRAISDLITAIESDSMTKIRTYLPAYDNIDATIPREGWTSYLLPQLILALRVLSMDLLPLEIIANDQRITEEQRTEILEKFEGRIASGTVMHALISLCATNNMTEENMISVALHKNPIAIADALCILQRAHILNNVNRSAIQAHQNLRAFVELLNAMYRRNILDQGTFNAIISINAHQNQMYKIISANIDVVIYVMDCGIELSELTALEPDKLFYVLSDKDRVTSYLRDTSTLFFDLMLLNIDQLGLVLISERGHDLVRNHHISIQMLANLSSGTLARVLNFKSDYHSKGGSSVIPIDLAVSLIRLSQPDSLLMQQMLQMEREGVLKSTIRQLWKDTRQHNVTRNSIFLCCTREPSYPERTYREIQKTFDSAQSAQDKVSYLIELIVLFAGNLKETQQPFAVALDKTFNLGLMHSAATSLVCKM